MKKSVLLGLSRITTPSGRQDFSVSVTTSLNQRNFDRVIRLEIELPDDFFTPETIKLDLTGMSDKVKDAVSDLNIILGEQP